jgi:hypothetical protein
MKMKIHGCPRILRAAAGDDVRGSGLQPCTDDADILSLNILDVKFIEGGLLRTKIPLSTN